MKTIDWTKPVRFTTGDPLKVIATHRGKAFVTWGTAATAHSVAEDGRVETVNGYYVENVPEEPADTICLYRCGGKWYVNGFRQNGKPWAQKQVAPRSVWEAEYPGGLGPDRMLVKVPV